ncbi:hypothetical protein PQR71_42110 [Paraburkholderia fungorum]
MTSKAEQIEAIKRDAQDLLRLIQEQGIEMEPEFMRVLELLATNPERQA